MTRSNTRSGLRSRLTNTQRLTARGAAILALTAAVAAMLGAAGPDSSARGIYTGTLELRFPLPPPAELDSTRLLLADAERELLRARRLIDFSARYGIAADLASLIYDTAEDEGLDPELAFRVVQHESRFNPLAVSTADALGLAQVQEATARFYVPDITREDLFDRATNLSIGFRFLADLIAQFDGDMRLALIAYNRGPARLRSLLAGGVDPWNGYASTVLDGYQLPEPSGT